MDFHRAKEIVKSADHIQVLYKDKQIWIEGLNEADETADVTTGSQFEKRMTVPINQLVEVHNKH